MSCVKKKILPYFFYINSCLMSPGELMGLNPLPDRGPLIDHDDLHGCCRWGPQMAPAMECWNVELAEEMSSWRDGGMCLATVASTQDA